ncbi:glycosyltransferase [Actinoalloteichus fjordicus]|uniref:Glycosyltransferase like family 2 n=1 Tax=Actinoalloteichus fjordicus TaxID=1612552 RepID=A0AAC9L9K1_9PSEU|nr:glycosyltransferase [Actinoalloteichus fjordicus]APU13617.1 Glycosyltransferase like family 2 [Actinoalloteichus fjordicus]
MITAVGVVIPARDEGCLLGACLQALRRALLELPPRLGRAVCVVADRCTDDTAAVARAAFGGWRAGLVESNGRELPIGLLRDHGVRALRPLLRGHSPSRTLLLNTDADSTVDSGWAREHVARAAEGSHAIAGMADLDLLSLSPHARARYQRVIDGVRRREGHGNVYCANLAVRADAYASVGGFGPVPTGEDHDLWRRLEQAGYLLRFDSGARVTTSPRLTGRARHGLADLLRSLHDAPADRAPEVIALADSRPLASSQSADHPGSR